MVGERIAETAVAPHLNRAQLLEVARDRRLGDRETLRGEPLGQILLIGEGLATDQLGDGPVPLLL